ncbi:MAG: hypothetical protein H7257_08600, partial [Taibaiella sp.]|nr:hypothetical protein [Taibaiella sp.]
MLKKAGILISILFIAFINNAHAQDDFCEAVSVILKDAPNQFKNVRTNLVQTSVNLKVYKTGVKVPGTINSRFVDSRGLFYEGALYQSKDLSSMRAYYDKYKKLLEDCLAPKGLKMKFNENFYPGLSEYKKVVY